MEERNKKLFVKPSNIEFDPRAKMKGKGGSATRHHIRRTVIEQVGDSTFRPPAVLYVIVAWPFAIVDPYLQLNMLSCVQR